MIAPPHIVDDGSEPGSWFEAIYTFPNSLRILDDASSKLPDADSAETAPGIVSRREGVNPSLETALSARALNPEHDIDNNREPRRYGH